MVSAPLTVQPSAQEGVALRKLEVPSDPTTASARAASASWGSLARSCAQLEQASETQEANQMGSP